jgi:hypothetical protein
LRGATDTGFSLVVLFSSLEDSCCHLIHIVAALSGIFLPKFAHYEQWKLICWASRRDRFASKKCESIIVPRFVTAYYYPKVPLDLFDKVW